MHSSNKTRSNFLYKSTVSCLLFGKMNQDKINEKARQRSQYETKVNASGDDKFLKLKVNNEVKDNNKRDALKSKSRNKVSSGSTYDQCFSGSTYEEECPVNYSLKYSETENCKDPRKNESPKGKFKEFTDYAETDLDQPTDFSLKYAEKNCSDEEIKNSEFSYFESDRRKFKEFADYAETDLDQPTDFTLKYGESSEEDTKTSEFDYYESQKSKTSDCYVGLVEGEDPSNERTAEQYSCQDETPLMFSRSSSLNSLSSFVQITQSIPDDRSSVVSDFSRMTSGIISPSELPDSPTQTAPSSPKRIKPPVCYSTKTDFATKRSVFEDDVATYKQEDTPIEFSRATSLSSLNIDNLAKSEFIPKGNTNLVVAKEENSVEQMMVTQPKEPSPLIDKTDSSKGKFELPSASEGNKNSLVDCTGINIQEPRQSTDQNSSQLTPNNVKNFMSTALRETNRQVHQNTEFPLKPDVRLKFHNETEKVYSSFEVSEDAVHTYYTEGTPANISHAGSHSDLTSLDLVSDIPSLGIHDNSEDGSVCFETILDIKLKSEKEEILSEDVLVPLSEVKVLPVSSKEIIPNGNIYLNNQFRFDYLRKEHQMTTKGETSAFPTENNSCNFTMRSSFSDLTVNVVDSPLCLNRVEVGEEPSSQLLSPLHNVSPQSPNSINLGDTEYVDKVSEERKIFNEWDAKALERGSLERDNEDENVKNYSNGESDVKYSRETFQTSLRPTPFDFYCSDSLSPFEEVLLEQCILLGMPQKKSPSNTNGNVNLLSGGKITGRNTGFTATKSIPSKSRCWKPVGLQPQIESLPNELNVLGGCIKTEPLKFSSVDNFDLESSEPLTLFEEALLEQCIRLGMSQKGNLKKLEKNNFKSTDGGDHVTPLEAALLEECIRLGMPQRRGQKKLEEITTKSSDFFDEPSRIMSSVTGQLNKLRLSSDVEKEKEGLKKVENFGCNCGRRHSSSNNNSKRKSSNFRRFKKSKD